MTSTVAHGGVELAPDGDQPSEALALSLWHKGRRDEAIALLERQIAEAKDAGKGSVPTGSVSGSPAGVDLVDPVPMPAVSYLPILDSSDKGQTGERSVERAVDEPPPAVPAYTPPVLSRTAQANAVTEAGRSPRRTWPRPSRVLGALTGLAVVFFAAAVLWVGWGLHRIDLDKPPNPRPYVLLEAADGTPITQSGGSYAGPVTRAEIPEHLVQAVLAIEDRRFYDHIGFDLQGILRASWRNLRAGGIVEGGSTITQQLAKVLFLHPEQTMRRKLQDAVLATMLEWRLTKDEILTKYLDSIYFGAGATGVSAAAKIYFEKPVAELSLAESAMLAGVLQSPSRLNPLVNLEGARERASIVLNAMVDAGFINRSDALAALLIPATPVRNYAVAQTGSWFGDWVHSAATDAMGPLAGAARIRTTLQPRTQAIAENVMRTVLDRGDGSTAQAALVAMTPDGAVVAMVGGRAYDDTQFNRAVDAQRPPGSAFSISVYLAALRLGWKLDDTVPDAPLNVAGSSMEDAAASGQSITLEQAFVRSHDGATLRIAEEVGRENVVRAARDLGIEANLDGDPGLGAGTREVNLLDLTGAYASVAAGRLPVQPWAILGVSEDTGTSPSVAREAVGQGPEPEHLDQIRRLLSAALVQGTAGAIALDGSAGGRSATSEAFRDGWFIGYTENLIAGVWVGNDDNSPLDAKTARELPAEIWRNFMAKAAGLKEAESLPKALPEAVGVPVAQAPSGAEPVLPEPSGEAVASVVGEQADAAQPPLALPGPVPKAPPATAQARPPPESRVPRGRPEPDNKLAGRPAEAEPRAAPRPPAAAPKAAPSTAAQPRPAKREPARPRVAPRQTHSAPALASRPADAAPRVTKRQPEPPRVAKRQPEAQPRLARRPAEPAQRRGADGPTILLGGRGGVAPRAAGPAPVIASRPADRPPRVARRQPEAQPRLARRSPDAGPRRGTDGPTILLGGRGAVAGDGAAILLGGRGIPNSRAGSEPARMTAEGPRVLLGGRGSP